MSDRASALPGASFDGIVQVAEAGLRGMVTLKADLNAETAKAVKAVTGQDLPEARQIVEAEMSVAWMAPDELLILCPHDRADAVVADLSNQMGAAHHLALNVSDARAVFTLKGAGAKDVLGKLTPADLLALDQGEMRRSRLAQVPGAFWFGADGRATVICFRSVAQYVFDLLSNAARDGGEVGFH